MSEGSMEKDGMRGTGVSFRAARHSGSAGRTAAELAAASILGVAFVAAAGALQSNPAFAGMLPAVPTDPGSVVALGLASAPAAAAAGWLAKEGAGIGRAAAGAAARGEAFGGALLAGIVVSGRRVKEALAGLFPKQVPDHGEKGTFAVVHAGDESVHLVRKDEGWGWHKVGKPEFDRLVAAKERAVVVEIKEDSAVVTNLVKGRAETTIAQDGSLHPARSEYSCDVALVAQAAAESLLRLRKDAPAGKVFKKEEDMREAMVDVMKEIGGDAVPFRVEHAVGGHHIPDKTPLATIKGMVQEAARHREEVAARPGKASEAADER